MGPFISHLEIAQIEDSCRLVITCDDTNSQSSNFHVAQDPVFPQIQHKFLLYNAKYLITQDSMNNIRL